jgi:hypothetical protein
VSVNYFLIKKYIIRNYVISNIEPSMPSCFRLFGKESGEQTSEWFENDMISKIFCVDNIFVKKVFKDIAKEIIEDGNDIKISNKKL